MNEIKDAHISVNNLQIFDVFKKQINKTVNITKIYLMELEKYFKKKINYEYKTENFNLRVEKLSLFISG